MKGHDKRGQHAKRYYLAICHGVRLADIAQAEGETVEEIRGRMYSWLKRNPHWGGVTARRRVDRAV